MAIDVASEVPVATVYRNVAPRSSSGVSPTHTIPEAMRRLHLPGRGNILKRLLIHVAGFNLSLIMRKLLGTGTPRAFAALLRSLRSLYEALRSTLGAQGHRFWRRHRTIIKITLNDIAYAC